MPSRTKRLAKARKTRSQASRILGALEAGEVPIERILIAHHPPVSLSKVRIYVLLLRVPRMGEVSTKKCLMKANVWPTTTFGNLTASERDRIYQNLPPTARKGVGS